MEEVTSNDFSELTHWINQNQYIFPENIRITQGRVLLNYDSLLKDKRQSLQNLKLLRQAMGFTPKSERGSQEKHAGAI